VADAPTAEILDLSVEGGTLLYQTRVTGPADLTVDMIFTVYDADGVERWRQEYAWGTDPFAREMNTQIEWPVGTFADSTDYGAWLHIWVKDASQTVVASAEKGVAFMTGRGMAYASTEAPPQESSKDAMRVLIQNTRLEGSWVVFDMYNNASHDLEVTHILEVTVSDTDELLAKTSGDELVRAGATQQAHHLLPETLANGRYTLMPLLDIHGTGAPWPGDAIGILVEDGVITVQ
jgi:hypothetical protein